MSTIGTTWPKNRLMRRLSSAPMSTNTGRTESTFSAPSKRLMVTAFTAGGTALRASSMSWDAGAAKRCGPWRSRYTTEPWKCSSSMWSNSASVLERKVGWMPRQNEADNEMWRSLNRFGLIDEY